MGKLYSKSAGQKQLRLTSLEERIFGANEEIHAG